MVNTSNIMLAVAVALGVVAPAFALPMTFDGRAIDPFVIARATGGAFGQDFCDRASQPGTSAAVINLANEVAGCGIATRDVADVEERHTGGAFGKDFCDRALQPGASAAVIKLANRVADCRIPLPRS